MKVQTYRNFSYKNSEFFITLASKIPRKTILLSLFFSQRQEAVQQEVHGVQVPDVEQVQEEELQDHCQLADRCNIVTGFSNFGKRFGDSVRKNKTSKLSLELISTGASLLRGLTGLSNFRK